MTTRSSRAPRRRGLLRWLVAAFALVITASGAAVWAANPFTATYSHDRQAIFWILHISDPHVGASAIEGPHALEHLEWALGEAVEVIEPSFIVNSGDLVDGSIAGIPASGQSQDEWDDYAGAVAASGMFPDYYLDLAGNHDGYGDIGLSYYLGNSMNGVYAGVPYRDEWLSFPFGDYLICGVDTAGDGSNIFVEAPAYTDDQVVALTGALDPSESAQLVLLFGHHRISRPDNAAPVIALAQDNGAFWFHGHEHTYETYLEDYVVSAQVNSLGKRDSNNLAVVAVDNNSVAYGVTSSSDPWPMVVVTAPANVRLTDGEVNPYAYEVCNTGTENPVRALVFDAAPVLEVSFSAGGAGPVEMTQDPDQPQLWYGLWDTTGLPAGETSLTVTAEGTTTHSASITVLLADVACPPPPVEPPDAGPPDAGPSPDAGEGPDAGPVGPDAGPGVDAGEPPAKDGGCGCRSSGGSGAPVAPFLVIGWLWLRRRRAVRPAGKRAC